MAARSNWKGYLKLSLVSCPVQLFPATSSKDRVAFHLLNRETGNRLRRKLVDPDTDEAVDSDDQVKGYAVGKNEYVLVEEDEIEKVAIESSHTIDIEAFVPRAEIDGTFLDTPYFLAPDGQMAEEAFAVIRDAMADKKVVGLGRVVLYRRERPVLLEPRGKGLTATTLRYAYEVRDDADYFDDIADKEVSEEMLDLATHIIGRKMTHFDPKRFEDRYQNALLELIEAKREHRPVKSANTDAKPGNVVNLMDALRKSIANDPGAKDASAGRGRTAAKTKSEATKSEAAEKRSAKTRGGEAAPVEKSAAAGKGAGKTASTARRTTPRKSAGRMRKAG